MWSAGLLPPPLFWWIPLILYSCRENTAAEFACHFRLLVTQQGIMLYHPAGDKKPNTFFNSNSFTTVRRMKQRKKKLIALTIKHILEFMDLVVRFFFFFIYCTWLPQEPLNSCYWNRRFYSMRKIISNVAVCKQQKVRFYCFFLEKALGTARLPCYKDLHTLFIKMMLY